jgi:DNA-binding response OmpR family regulator
MKTILIIHREDTLLKGIVDLLTAYGYDARTAPTLEGAVAAIGRGLRPAAVIIDEASAGAGWHDRLRVGDAHGQVAPSVLLTWRPRAHHPPGTAILAKPYSARDLLDTIAGLLGSGATSSASTSE